MPRSQITQRATRESKVRRPDAATPTVESPPANALATTGPTNETPLEYMLRVMRDPNEDDDRRDAMAKAALPYMHARLSSVDGQVSDNEGGTITFTWQPVQN